MTDSKSEKFAPEKVAGREKEPEISASVTDELREEEGEVGPTEEEAKRRRSLKPLIAIMTRTTSKKNSRRRRVRTRSNPTAPQPSRAGTNGLQQALTGID